MNLPPDFQFSQTSLQDFVDCPRRFLLRHVQRVHWPAVETEPLREWEEHMERGDQFHRLVHQHLVGIPAEILTRSIDDEQVEGWWQSFLDGALTGLPEQRYPEITLTAPLAGQRIVAKYDLIAIEPGERALIVDWKTALRRPKREWMAAKLQTVIYRYVLVLAGLHLNEGTPLLPDQVTMMYWYAEYPHEPEVFAYDDAQFATDKATLEALATDILAREPADFPLTDHVRHCKYCSYRSLCERGGRGGEFDLMDDDGAALALGPEFDLDQIAEIEF
jgi:CRISPR/Cas system-associated exonuclease Cas4 (RecB family)